MIYSLELVKKVTDPEERVEYELYRIRNYEVTVKTYESGYKHINVRVSTENANNYTPEIIYMPAIVGERPRFKIQTTSYGSLIEYEYIQLMTAMMEALEVTGILDREFIDKKEE